VIAVLVAVAVFAWLYVQRRKTALRQRFGPEYEQVVREQGSERKAEAQLTQREKRVEKLKIRDLEPAERDRFSNEWRAVQARFVDDPQAAVTDADALVSSLMQTRGYPVADFDQRAADVSVDHPGVVANYRAAHDVASRIGKGDVSTDDLRTATIHYRSLFEELIRVPTVVTTKKKEVA